MPQGVKHDEQRIVRRMQIEDAIHRLLFKQPDETRHICGLAKAYQQRPVAGVVEGVHTRFLHSPDVL